jgi:hypothetical protein
MCLEINRSFLVLGHTFLQTDSHCGLVETETGKSDIAKHARVNALNAKLNPICYLLALLGAHHILHVSRVRVKESVPVAVMKTPDYKNMQNLCNGKGEEKLRWDKNTAERFQE